MSVTINHNRRRIVGAALMSVAAAQAPRAAVADTHNTFGPLKQVLSRPHGRIAHRFHARDLHLVMGPAVAGSAIRFRVLIDGKAPGAAHGLDIDAQGNGTLTGQRMYQLIRQPGPIADRTFEIEFLDAGAEAFAFTFG
jgi:hypothetical protein